MFLNVFLNSNLDLLLGIGIPFTIKVIGEPGQELAVSQLLCFDGTNFAPYLGSVHTER